MTDAQKTRENRFGLAVGKATGTIAVPQGEPKRNPASAVLILRGSQYGVNPGTLNTSPNRFADYAPGLRALSREVAK